MLLAPTRSCCLRFASALLRRPCCGKLQNMEQATFQWIFVSGLCQGLPPGLIFKILPLDKPNILGAATLA